MLSARKMSGAITLTFTPVVNSSDPQSITNIGYYFKVIGEEFSLYIDGLRLYPTSTFSSSNLELITCQMVSPEGNVQNNPVEIWAWNDLHQINNTPPWVIAASTQYTYTVKHTSAATPEVTSSNSVKVYLALWGYEISEQEAEKFSHVPLI